MRFKYSGFLHLIWGLAFLAVIFSSTTATAITINESADAPGGDFPDGGPRPPIGFSIGALDDGTNMVFGSLDGVCEASTFGGGDCNPASGAGDGQDTFYVEIATGFQLDNLFVSTQNAVGPLNISGFFSFSEVAAFTVQLFRVSPLELNTSTGDLVSSPIGEGLYRLSVSGNFASEEGPYSFDYSLQLDVSQAAVPIPSALPLFATALGGLGIVGWSRRRRGPRAG